MKTNKKTTKNADKVTKIKDAPKPKADQRVGVESGGTILVSEAVGAHFRAAKGHGLTEGSMICVTVNHKNVAYEIPMMVRYTKELKSGLTLVMAFLVKGQKQGFHEVLGAQKGNKATVTWE